MTLFLAISNKADRKEIVCGKRNGKPVKKSYDHSENRAHTHTYVRGKSRAETENGHPHRVSRNENRAPEEQKSTSCYHMVGWVIREQKGTQQKPTSFGAVGGIFCLILCLNLQSSYKVLLFVWCYIFSHRVGTIEVENHFLQRLWKQFVRSRLGTMRAFPLSLNKYIKRAWTTEKNANPFHPHAAPPSAFSPTKRLFYFYTFYSLRTKKPPKNNTIAHNKTDLVNQAK